MQADVSSDSPEGVKGKGPTLDKAADDWIAAISNKDAQDAVLAGLNAAKADADAAHTAAITARDADKANMDAAHADATTKCDAMRAGGYSKMSEAYSKAKAQRK